VFNAKSVDMGFVEIIRPVAADRLETEKPDLRGLWNHNSDQTIARVSAGTMRVEKRTRGVYATYVPPAWASSHLESVARRDITGQSFGFIAIDDQWHLEDSEPVREIFDMEVIETSAVAFPAYPQTTLRTVSAGERHQDKSARLGRRLRLVG
jgi:HK97 family phage prohead protease